MCYYRLYHLGGPAGRIVAVEEFDADGDDAAIWRSQQLSVGGPMELWCLSRRVRQFPGAAIASARLAGLVPADA